MADEDNGGNGSAAESAPEGSAAAAIQGMLGKITTAELLIAIAAGWLLIVAFLIGDVITSDWGVSKTEYLMALGMLVGMFFYHRNGDEVWRPFYPWALNTGAWALGIVGVIQLFDELFDEGSYSGAQQFYWVTEWIFGIVFLVGAYMLMQERAKASS